MSLDSVTSKEATLSCAMGLGLAVASKAPAKCSVHPVPLKPVEKRAFVRDSNHANSNCCPLPRPPTSGLPTTHPHIVSELLQVLQLRWMIPPAYPLGLKVQPSEPYFKSAPPPPPVMGAPRAAPAHAAAHQTPPLHMCAASMHSTGGLSCCQGLLKAPQYVAGILQRALFQPSEPLRHQMQPYLRQLEGVRAFLHIGLFGSFARTIPCANNIRCCCRSLWTGRVCSFFWLERVPLLWFEGGGGGGTGCSGCAVRILKQGGY